MSLPKVVGRTGAQGRLENQAIYDTEGIATGGVTQLSFFTNGFGSVDASGTISAGKNYGDTNLAQNAQLSAGQEMTVESLQLKITSATPGTALSYTDITKFYARSWLTFTISQIVIWQGPTIDVPSGCALQSFGSTTADTKALYQNGTGHPSSVLSVQSEVNTYVNKPVNGQNVKVVAGRFKAFPTIDSNEAFSVTINWPSATSTFSVAVLVSVYLNGKFLRPM